MKSPKISAGVETKKDAESQGHIVVVGLGPAGWRQLTVDAVETVQRATTRFLRTRHHAVAADFTARGLSFASFDHFYEEAFSLDAAYDAMVEALLTAALAAGSTAAPVCYGVPGSPFVAESTVARLQTAAPARGVRVNIVNGLSFIEPVLAAVRVDPLSCGLFVADGHRLETQLLSWQVSAATRPALLVSQLDTSHLLAEAKLTCLEYWPPEHPVALVFGAGSPEQEVHHAALAEIDHGQNDPGHLACLWLPALPVTEAADAKAEHGRGVGAQDAGRVVATPVALSSQEVPQGILSERAPDIALDTSLDSSPEEGAAVEVVTFFHTEMPFPVMETHRAAGSAFARLVALQDYLRSPGGCTWDAEQTHHSLVPYLLEETYEVLEVLEALPARAPFPPDDGADNHEGVGADGDMSPEERVQSQAFTAPDSDEIRQYRLLEEELGDFLMQAVFHARLAEETGAFGISSVCDGIVAKLVSRHPAVFGVEVADSMLPVREETEVLAPRPETAQALLPPTSPDPLQMWEERKKREKPRVSALGDVPLPLPALTRVAKLQKRAERASVERSGVEVFPGFVKSLAVVRAALADMAELVDTASSAEKTARAEEELSGVLDVHVGRALFALVALARAAGETDPEGVLRRYARLWELAYREREALGEEPSYFLGF